MTTLKKLSGATTVKISTLIFLELIQICFHKCMVVFSRIYNIRIKHVASFHFFFYFKSEHYKKRGLSLCFQNCWDSPRERWDMVKIPILAFFSWRFKLPCSECGYRVVRTVTTLFKSAGKGIRPIPTLLKALE